MFFPSTSADDIREVLARYAVLAPPQPAPGPADWQRLRDKLGLAAAFAPTLKGVNQHRWRPGAPRRAAEIDAHELRIGVTFPAEYRAFLREIGDRAPGPNGTLRCLSNVCTHRGNLLVHTPCRAGQIRCGYHSRRFDLAGRMLFMPGFEGACDFPAASDHLPTLPLSKYTAKLGGGA